MKTILIVEDDTAIANGLQKALEAEHYKVKRASDGAKGLTIAGENGIDLIILDVMLPGLNGDEVCRELRESGNGTPIMMLTSRGEEADKVLGFEVGADDYMTKPFSIRELLMRVKALLRRKIELPNMLAHCSFGKVTLDFQKLEAIRDKKKVALTAREFAVLRCLIRREGEVVTREELLNEVWGYDEYPETRTVDIHMAKIRKKLEVDPSHPVHIVTVPTSGYKFCR